VRQEVEDRTEPCSSQADGMVNVQVSGLVLDDASVGDANGTADGVDAIAVAIVCGGKVIAQAEPVPLTKEGVAKLTGKLAVLENCASPVVVVRERYDGSVVSSICHSYQCEKCGLTLGRPRPRDRRKLCRASVFRLHASGLSEKSARIVGDRSPLHASLGPRRQRRMLHRPRPQRSGVGLPVFRD
jgi:hypothetical protein